MNGTKRELEVAAKTEKLEEVQAFVGSILEENDCSMKAQMAIEVSVEEIFVNIANYAYAPMTGTAVICVEVLDDPHGFSITFIDSGKPFNPLGKEDPDVTLSADERDIGGLGIYMTKKMMDDVSYEYKDGRNILRITKAL